MEKNKEHKLEIDPGAILEQLTIEAPDFDAESGNNIPNCTNDFSENTVRDTQKSCQSKEVKNLKTVDPVSEFGTLVEEESVKKFISDKDDDLLFSKLFPGVLRENVENDETFKLFAKNMPQSIPFTTIYSNFCALVEKISESEREKLIFSAKAANSSPGALASVANSDTFFTKDQVLRMSREQIARNYEKIRQSQERW